MSAHSLRPPGGRSDAVFMWLTRTIATIGVVATLWAGIATGAMLIHGHPAYTIVLAVVFLVSLIIGIRAWRDANATRRSFRVLRGALMAIAVMVIAACVWLVPFHAADAGLSSMRSGDGVTVTETATTIVLTPTQPASETGVFFQPGARVDARAYAGLLRPLAAAGHEVWITKQPLGIGFLATGAFDAVRTANPEVGTWVVGGHSLGGTVAAIDAENFSDAATSPVAGLVLYASYPATSMSAIDARVLSISASLDGLATAQKIDASHANLPSDTNYVVIEGAVHAFFGDYGAQPGDGEPEITQQSAQEIISAETLGFVEALSR